MRIDKKIGLGLAGLLALAGSMTAGAQAQPDPIGFCPPPPTVSACTTATGSGGETIGVGLTSFGMEKNGSGTSANPWDLFVLVPEATNGAVTAIPVLTSVGGVFTQIGATIDAGDFTPTTTGSIYDFTGTTGDGSMNASNLFGTLEQSAFGGTPADFEVFEYQYGPGLVSWTPYTFDATGLVAGTFLAASGGSNPFSTPFTTTGLVCGATTPGVPPLCSDSPPPKVPEPATWALTALAAAGLLLVRRRRGQARG